MLLDHPNDLKIQRLLLLWLHLAYAVGFLELKAELMVEVNLRGKLLEVLISNLPDKALFNLLLAE